MGPSNGNTTPPPRSGRSPRQHLILTQLLIQTAFCGNYGERKRGSPSTAAWLYRETACKEHFWEACEGSPGEDELFGEDHPNVSSSIPLAEGLEGSKEEEEVGSNGDPPTSWSPSAHSAPPCPPWCDGRKTSEIPCQDKSSLGRFLSRIFHSNGKTHPRTMFNYETGVQ